MRPKWEQSKGWWVNKALKIGVRQEDDYLWHSYIDNGELRGTTPGFTTRIAAQRNAERRKSEQDRRRKQART